VEVKWWEKEEEMKGGDQSEYPKYEY